MAGMAGGAKTAGREGQVIAGDRPASSAAELPARLDCRDQLVARWQLAALLDSFGV
jgi:hypothetical protein